ncbi:MAG: M48 family metallopeptidase [Parcubacteria group bacterium]|nr:M48 family metallopeptidase [Parcubacteria group bacterium]
MPRFTRSRDRAHYHKHREQARQFINETLERVNRQYGFAYNRVSIRNQQTRWGSCSADGNLNFSYKLLFLPLAHAEYVVAHELCHLKELNHSPAFWKLVEQTIPDYCAIRRTLKRHVA